MTKTMEWVVVGAGPAGIAAVGKLLDAGIHPQAILWLDPHFKVGDFGTAWAHVGSNTPVEYFLKFYQHAKAFAYTHVNRPPFMIDKIDPGKNCPLIIAAQPLHWITTQLRNRVSSLTDTVLHLSRANPQHWGLTLASGQVIYTKKVLLTIGGEAKTLNFNDIPTIPLKTALHLEKLTATIQPDDRVIVFGASQSAKNVMENLLQLNTQHPLLFYRSERSLERHFKTELLAKFTQLPITPRHLLNYMPNCTKIIYAIGFERRHIPIKGLADHYDYDPNTGEIAPGIFGLGMAFPEILPYELGQAEYRVTAIWPFMKRLQKLLPGWLN